jgi:hypothetical protein
VKGSNNQGFYSLPSLPSIGGGTPPSGGGGGVTSAPHHHQYPTVTPLTAPSATNPSQSHTQSTTHYQVC